MNRYFKNCTTAEEVKKEFTRLAKALHPDNGGDAEEFKIMMNEYRRAWNTYKNIHETAEGEAYEKETTETAEQFADIILPFIHFTDITIEIIGSWVWMTGATYNYSEQLKTAGFWFSKSKKAWYLNPNGNKKRRGHYSMNKLREKYGSEEVKTTPQAALA